MKSYDFVQKCQSKLNYVEEFSRRRHFPTTRNIIQKDGDFEWEYIRGFDYLRFHSNTLNLLSAGFSLDYSRIFVLLVSKMSLYGENSAPLLSAVLVFEGLSKNVTSANNEGRLYFENGNFNGKSRSKNDLKSKENFKLNPFRAVKYIPYYCHKIHLFFQNYIMFC